MRFAARRHGQYVWRDPESDEQLRVDVFGSEEFFQDLAALGFVPSDPATDPSAGPAAAHGHGRGESARSALPSARPGDEASALTPDASALLEDDDHRARPIRQLHAGAHASNAGESSEGRAGVRRKGA